MVDKETKRKLRRIWCARLVIGGLYVPVTLGFSIVELQSVCREVNSTWKTTQTVQQAKLAEQLAKKMVVQKEQAQQQAMEQAKQSQLQAKQSRVLPDQATAEEMKKVQMSRLAHRSKLQNQQTRQQVVLARAKTYQAYKQALRSMRQTVQMRQAIRTRQQAQQAWQKFHQAEWQAGQARGQAQQAQQAHIQAVYQAEQQQQTQWQKLQRESLLLSMSAFCFIVVLLLLLRQQNRISLSLTGQLICFLPEECIAELEALRQQLKSEHHSIWLIRRIMFWTFLNLLWALYFQINIENLLFPPFGGNKKIDK